MTAQVQSLERREVLNVARRYRRDGYKVSGPDKWQAKPAFLGDFMPDLIAERDDDKVGIEVKRATTIRGSNEILELTERVATQPGWRFELIAVPELAEVTAPDMSWGSEQIDRLLDRGFPKAAFVLVYAMIEHLIAFAMFPQGKKSAFPPSPDVVRELVVQGIIGEDTRRRIDDARVRRNAIVHDGGEPAPTRADVEALMKLGTGLEREVSAAGEA